MRSIDVDLRKMTQSSTRTQTFLAIWLAIGLIVQTSFALVPIGNYATLVYWLFYAPFLALLILFPLRITGLIHNADRLLVVVFLIFILWTATTTLWAETEATSLAIFLEFAKRALLITFYVLGAAYLAFYHPAVLRIALISASVVVAMIALASIVFHYGMQDAPLSRRLAVFGYEKYGGDQTNAVVTGIYFGLFSALSFAFIATAKRTTIKAFLWMCSGLCLVAVAFTGTRTASLALLLSFLLFLILQKRFLLAVSIATILVAVSTLGYLVESFPLHDYFARGGLGSLRPQIWAASLKESTSHFWFGNGLWRDFGLPVVVEGLQSPSIQAHSHNYYLQLLNWTGLIGLCLYLVLLVRSLMLSYQARHIQLAGASLLAISYFVVVQLFDVYDIFTNPSYYWPCLWLPLGVLAGTLARCPSQPGNSRGMILPVFSRA